MPFTAKKTIWFFIGVYIINRIQHVRLWIRILIFSCSSRYLTSERTWTLEDKIRIHVRACNILYLLHGRAEMRNFSSSARSLVKYFSKLEEKFRISARPCDILYLFYFQILDSWTRAPVLKDFSTAPKYKECVRIRLYNIARVPTLFKSYWVAMKKIFTYARLCVNKDDVFSFVYVIRIFVYFSQLSFQ